MTQATQRLATGASWLYSLRWLERLLDFISVVILARLLSPDDFGLVAIAASVVAIIEGLAAFDVNKVLIRSRDDDRALFDTAWTLSVLRGLVAALVMVSTAPFLRDERIGDVMFVLALAPLFTGFSNPRFVVFERDLVYSRFAILMLGAKVASFCVTLMVAVLYRSFWALVAGILAGTLVSMVLSYALSPYRPKPSLARFSDIFAFSGWLSLTSVVTTLSMGTDKIIVGRLLGVAEAGLYFMTQRVGVLPTRELISPLQRILFPSFSEIVDDRERLRRVVRESINVLGSLSLAAGCGFALVASDFVPLVLGAKWEVIVPLLVVYVPSLGLRATLSMTLPCMMALGRTRLLFWVSFFYALVHVPAFVVATVYFGLPGTFWSLVATSILYTYLNTWMLRETLGITLVEILVELRRPLCAVVLMVVGVWALGMPGGSWGTLVVKVLVGVVVFCGVQYGIWRLEGRPGGIERRLLQVVVVLKPR